VRPEEVLFFDRRTRSNGSTHIYLATDRVPRGEVWQITHITFEDEDSPFSSARLYRGTETRPTWLEEQLGPAAGRLYWSDKTHLLGEGEEIGVRFTGTTTGDTLVATFSGRRWMSNAQDRQPAGDRDSTGNT